MSKGLQWVIGICGVVMALAVVFGTVAPFFMPRVAVTVGGAAPSQGQTLPRFGFRGPGNNMFGMPYPMMGRGAMGFAMPFMRGGLYLGLVIVLVGLVILGAVWLNRRSRTPVVEAPAAAPAPAPATVPCPHCSQPLQAGWKACPYCGEKV